MHSTLPAWALQPIRLGVVINPFSRLNRETRWYEDPLLQKRGIAIRPTPSIDALPSALDELLEEKKSTVLGICGGDGTIHHTINALLARWSDRDREPSSFSSSCPSPPSFPPLLLLRGGTLNLLARTMRVEGDPKTLLLGLSSIWQGLRFEALPLRSLRLLRLETPSFGCRFGYIFGSDLTAWALHLYEEEFGGGYRGLARFLQEAIVGYLFRTPLWEASQPRFEGPPQVIQIDGSPRMCRAVVASTVDITLLAGLIKGLSVESPTPQTMQIRFLDPSPVSVLIRQIPRLVFGLQGPGIVDIPSIRSLRLTGSFSLDGEIYPQAPETPIAITSPPWTLPIVAPLP